MTKYAVIFILGCFLGWNSHQPAVAKMAQEWAGSIVREMIEPQKTTPAFRYERQS